MKILELPLKKKWYNMIESGEKREEYREIKRMVYRELGRDRFLQILKDNPYTTDKEILKAMKEEVKKIKQEKKLSNSDKKTPNLFGI